MRGIGVLALDLDGVLLEEESSWARYHDLLGTQDGRERNMRSFMSGEIDYRTWATRDAGLWKGMNPSPVCRYLESLKTRTGSAEMVSDMRSLDVVTAIISTGIGAVARRAAEILHIDLVEANDVEILGSRISGRVKVKCGFREKGLVLRRIAGHAGIPLDRCACVGNDENDIPMFQTAGFSIAYNPTTEEVASHASVVVRGRDLEDVRSILRDHFAHLRSCTASSPSHSRM